MSTLSLEVFKEEPRLPLVEIQPKVLSLGKLIFEVSSNFEIYCSFPPSLSLLHPLISSTCPPHPPQMVICQTDHLNIPFISPFPCPSSRPHLISLETNKTAGNWYPSFQRIFLHLISTLLLE